MVILDGDHSRENVAQELELYASMVTPGSLLLSQDGIGDKFWYFREQSGRGRWRRTTTFLDRHDEFEHDRASRQSYLLTDHPVGWMRRRLGERR